MLPVWEPGLTDALLYNFMLYFLPKSSLVLGKIMKEAESDFWFYLELKPVLLDEVLNESEVFWAKLRNANDVS